LPTARRLYPVYRCPRIEIRAVVANLAAELVVGWTHTLVTPLAQLCPVADQFQLRIAGKIYAALIEKSGHRNLVGFAVMATDYCRIFFVYYKYYLRSGRNRFSALRSSENTVTL
jgi:hypothetical protein